MFLSKKSCGSQLGEPGFFIDVSVDVDVDHAVVDVYETAMLVYKVFNMGDKVLVEDDNHPRESKQFQ